MKNILLPLFLLLCGITQAQIIKTTTIPAGSFYMGNDIGGDEDESPIHKVTINQSFEIGITEVTNAQYELFCPQHKAQRGERGISNDDNEAVVNVSYNDAIAFCKWLSEKEGKIYRLPTEAEWEYCCRAGSYTQFSSGDGIPSDCYRNQENVRDFVKVDLEVAKSTPNAFGLYDMHGGVEELCYDYYAPYSSQNQINPCGLSKGEYRVTRGGSHNTPTFYLRSANRSAMIPEDKNCQVGFRVVCSSMPLNFYDTEVSIPLNQKCVKKKNVVWKKVSSTTPLYIPPTPFVIPPKDTTPFYKHNHQCAICYCDNGDLLAIWFSTDAEGGRKMVVVASRLRYGKSNWEPASLFFQVPDRNVTGSAIFNDGTGRLLHINGVADSGDWKHLAMILRISEDNGATWTKAKIIESQHTTRHQVIAGTFRTSKGDIVQLCDAGPEGNDGAAIHISKDNGVTWHDMWNGEPLPHFTEGGVGTTIAGIHASAVELKDGSLLALGRGNSIKNNKDEKRMPLSISKDGGKTWQYHASPFPPIDGGQRLVLLRLHEGPIMLVSFTDHPQRTPKNERGLIFRDGNKEFKGYGMYVALSYDEGNSWQIKRLITDQKERFLNGGGWTGYFISSACQAEPRGYLAGVQSPDNMIHILSSRLHYRFNLAWIEEK